MHTPSPADLPLELLAAYADGELDAAGRARVERWLREHPEGQDLVKVQQELSPANSPLWDAVEPPAPAAAAWAAVRNKIEAGVSSSSIPPRPLRFPRVAGWLLAAAAAGSAAAVMAWLAFGPVQQPAPSRSAQPIELAGNTAPEIEPSALRLEPAPSPHVASAEPPAAVVALPMATDDDVVLERVPALRSGWLPSGQHPVSGTIELATEEDVLLEEVNPNAAWPNPSGPRMTIAPGDAPMIFAAKPR